MNLEALIYEDMDALRTNAARNGYQPASVYDKLAEASLVQHAASAMREKLAEARRRGRGGWWNDKDCQLDDLRTLLREHVDKGDMRDVMNLAAMVYIREITDGPRPEADAQVIGATGSAPSEGGNGS